MYSNTKPKGREKLKDAKDILREMRKKFEEKLRVWSLHLFVLFLFCFLLVYQLLFLLFWFLLFYFHLFLLHFLLLLNFHLWLYPRNFQTQNSLISLHTWQRLQSWKIIILTNGINSFQKFQNIPNSNFPTRISSNKKISSLKLQFLHIFNSIGMRLKMNATLILPMPPYSNLPFFSCINPIFTCNKNIVQKSHPTLNSVLQFYFK